MHCSHIISTMKKAAATKMAQTRHIYMMIPKMVFQLPT
jgi:hypothetical protein